ncbi:MAG: Predicted phosphatase [uncultured Sulfurovum sp.]|uniref:phosphoglycolate phosphatase n=1 Tax=uncultured Sulfurovum sp. TaxID=269237 RepID=A0A6S6U463_9BACT|nr:MAG: Predicted phosphatase [uncultured Sulfurovum sp.]
MYKSVTAKKKLIIFDMDGTLVDSSITIANAINYVRANLGFEAMDKAYILKYVNEPDINPAQFFYHAKAFDRDHEKWFSEYYSKNHDQELVLYEGIKALLENLKSKGYLIAVATNAYRKSTLESLGHLNILQLFDAIGCHDDVPLGKPAPDMLYKVMDELGVGVRESIFIGDGPRDELAAKKCDMDYVMVEWGFTDHSDAVRSVVELEALLEYV